jgi:hypothetical protein
MKSISANTAIVGFASGALDTRPGVYGGCPEASLSGEFGFRWGQQRDGLFAVRPGSPCRVRLHMRGVRQYLPRRLSNVHIVAQPYLASMAPFASNQTPVSLARIL